MAKNDFDELMSVGIEFDKDVLPLRDFDPDGCLVLRRKIKRHALAATFEDLYSCVASLEACMSVHRL